MSILTADDPGPLDPWLPLIDVLTLAVLAVTLLVTVRLAMATRNQANATLGQLKLQSAVNARALISVRSMRIQWVGGGIASIDFSVGNSGLGAAFNVVVSVRGCGRQWRVAPPDREGDPAGSGGLRSGESRSFVATPKAQIDDQFDNRLIVEIEAFDVLREHFVYEHSFRVAQGVAYGDEDGLTIQGPTKP